MTRDAHAARRRAAGARIITLLTDFGSADGYVGAVKGVLTTMAPKARIIDITHDIRPGDVRGGALALETAAGHFPQGTIHVAVVDPGVGTDRRAVVVAANGAYFVGPDNGVLTLAAVSPRRVYALDRVWLRRDKVSPTFHGRDVFAPIAAKLACGASPIKLGSVGTDLVPLALPNVTVIHDGVVGTVIHCDRFGNLITNVRESDLRESTSGKSYGSIRITVGRRRVLRGLVRTYGDASRGALIALVGSSGRMEIACRDGSAAESLGYHIGRSLEVRIVWSTAKPTGRRVGSPKTRV